MPRSLKFPPPVTKWIERFDLEPSSVTLEEAKRWLRLRVRKPGAFCPCCQRFAKVYKRSIHHTMAVVLILMARRQPRGEFFHVPRYLAGLDLAPSFQAVATHGGDYAKLRNWGLIEAQPGERGDGSTRTGFWRVTDLGFDFVHDRVRVWKHSIEYDNRLMGLDDEAGEVSIRDCLGDRFNYDELMKA